MGGGGVSGSVSFPAYLQDSHGQLMAGVEVDTAGGGVYDGVNQAPNHNVMELLNSAWSTDPFTSFSFTSPTTDLAASKSQFDLFYAGVTGRLDEGDYATYMANALAMVTTPSTSDIPDIVFNCDPLNFLGISNKADSSAKGTLMDALKFVRNMVGTQVFKDIVESFENKREITYQNQISQFMSTMADINAVNSSASLFGAAILRAEQMREVSEFDSQLGIQILQQGLNFYVTHHQTQIRTALSVESENARIDFETQRVNKIAKEQRYVQSVGQLLHLITNRVEYERVAAHLLTEQNRIKILATQEYEGDVLDIDIRDQLWEIEIAERGARILSAPAGMTATVPHTPSKSRSAVGGAMQGAGAGASVGTAIGAAGGPIGAGGGALIGGALGGVGGLL